VTGQHRITRPQFRSNDPLLRLRHVGAALAPTLEREATQISKARDTIDAGDGWSIVVHAERHDLYGGRDIPFATTHERMSSHTWCGWWAIFDRDEAFFAGGTLGDPNMDYTFDAPNGTQYRFATAQGGYLTIRTPATEVQHGV